MIDNRIYMEIIRVVNRIVFLNRKNRKLFLSSSETDFVLFLCKILKKFNVFYKESNTKSVPNEDIKSFRFFRF